jgi:predicted nucleic-acid-binding protein
MRAIDTKVLVRLVARDDPDQVAAAETFVEQGAWVSSLALAESTSVLSTVYDLSSADLVRAIEMLLDHRKVVLQDADAVAAALEVFRAKPALGFSDCLFLELARAAGHLPLGTFDRSLSRIAGAEKL